MAYTDSQRYVMRVIYNGRCYLLDILSHEHIDKDTSSYGEIPRGAFHLRISLSEVRRQAVFVER